MLYFVRKPGYRLDISGTVVRFLTGTCVLSPKCPDCLWNPPSLLFNGYRGFSWRENWPGCEADHSTPSGAQVKNGGLYISAPSACHRGGQVDILTFITTVCVCVYIYIYMYVCMYVRLRWSSG